MQNITFVLYPDMLASSITLPIEMLRAGESFAKVVNRNAEQLAITTVAENDSSLISMSGLPIKADHGFDCKMPADIVFLPALWRNPKRTLESMSEILCLVNWQYENGAIISAVGTGVCFVAQAGLLDYKPATTHWHYFDEFQKRYPKVLLKRQYFITQSTNLYCSASINALADLTVHFIQRIYNSSIASHVERHFSHEIRRSYESIGFFDGQLNNHPDEDIVQAQMWLQDNYGKEIRFGDVAARFDMSVRSFNRRFKTATNKSPLQYLQEIRIQTAKELLKTSNLTISEIAFKVGYSDMGHFTMLFKKMLSTTLADIERLLELSFSIPKLNTFTNFLPVQSLAVADMAAHPYAVRDPAFSEFL